MDLEWSFCCFCCFGGCFSRCVILIDRRSTTASASSTVYSSQTSSKDSKAPPSCHHDWLTWLATRPGCSTLAPCRSILAATVRRVAPREVGSIRLGTGRCSFRSQGSWTEACHLFAGLSRLTCAARIGVSSFQRTSAADLSSLNRHKKC